MCIPPFPFPLPFSLKNMPFDFEHIAAELRPDLVKVGREFFASADDAEDVAQEALVRLWGFCERMGEARNVRALAIRIAKNVCIDMQRNRQGALFVSLDDPSTTSTMNLSAGADESPQDRMEREEATQRLHKAMNHLDQRERELLEMRIFQELRAEEIARRTGIAKTSVFVMISTAKRKIINFLNQQRT